MCVGSGCRRLSGVFVFWGRARGQIVIGAWVEFRLYVGSGCRRWSDVFVFWGRARGQTVIGAWGKLRWYVGSGCGVSRSFYFGIVGVGVPDDPGMRSIP